MKTKFINFFAGPGASKTTSSSGLFFELKKRGINSEIIVEYAKEKVWSEDFRSLECQPYITGKQFYRQWRVNGKVEYAVTDSPILLGLVYQGFGCDENWEKAVLYQFGLFDNLNIFLERNSEAHGFQQEGRMQNEQECQELDFKIRNLLDKNNIPYTVLKVEENCKHIEKVLDMLGVYSG